MDAISTHNVSSNSDLFPSHFSSLEEASFHLKSRRSFFSVFFDAETGAQNQGADSGNVPSVVV
jgi:hypothetical protein